MEADLRFATSDDDRAAVYRLRYELYVEDQGLFQEEADHERRWLKDDYDDQARLLLAEVGGKVVGTLRLSWGTDAPLSRDLRETYLVDQFEQVIDPGAVLVGTRLIVRPRYRGGALAFQLMWKMCEFAAENDVELILGNCEPHLVSHYRKLGLRPYGGLCNHPTNGALIRLAMIAGDIDYLREIRSPMLGALAWRKTPSKVAWQLSRIVSQDASVMSEESDRDEYWGEVARWLSEGEEGIRGILGDLSRDEASVLLAKSQILHCEPGVALIRKGHVSRTLYMLLAGSLEVHDHGALVARVDRRGAVVGEVAFFTPGRRMSDVIAGPDGARVLSLNNSTMREIISSHGPVAAKLLSFVATGLCEKLVERAQAR